jgi:NAD(P)-dependent dehydrogenase (short-subunit alcohol dehydrogenase family)
VFITIASINAFRGVEKVVGYNVAKAGVVELTRTMAVELARHGVLVNGIAPAQIDTRLIRGLSEEDHRKRVARIPLDRYGQPDEVPASEPRRRHLAASLPVPVA